MIRQKLESYSYFLRQTLPILIAVLCVFSSFVVSEEWTGFRGPQTDGSIDHESPFSPDGSFHVAWRTEIGSGYSGVVISNGFAVTMFSQEDGDYVAAYDTGSGKEVWRYRIGKIYVGHDGSHDGPIATPLIWKNNVIGLGPWGHLFSLELATGKLNWAIQLTESLGAEKPYYGFSTSPIVAANVLIIEIGAGPGKMVAGLDPTTGEQKWVLGEDTINFQSPVRMKWNEQEYVVTAGDTKLYGIDPAKGEISWEYAHGGELDAIAAASIVPVPVGDGRIWLKTKRDASTVLQLKEVDGHLTMEPLWSAGVLRATYSIPVYHDGFLYGFNGRIFSCVDAATGELKWRTRGPGDGFLLLLGDHLVIQAKDGTLHIGPASPDGWNETGQIHLFEDVSWTPTSWTNGALYARSMKELARVDWKTEATANTDTIDTKEDVAWGPYSSRFARFLHEVNLATNKDVVVDRFLSSIHQFPLIEWPDTVHFLYKGEAQDMAIAGDMIGYRHEEPMHRVSGTNLFYYTAKLEPDARIAYRFQKNYEDFIPDPRNERSFVSQRDEEMSWFTMPGWIASDHLLEAPPEKRGRIEAHEFDSKVENGGKIQMDIYLPAGYSPDSKPLPVAFIFGGEGAQKGGEMKNSLDNLLGESVTPTIVVFLNKLETTLKDRDPEVQMPVISKMLIQEIVPFIESKYKTISHPSARACIGAGFSGFDALFMVFTHPDTFAKVGGQSVFMLNWNQQMLMDAVPDPAQAPLSIYLDWGLYDMFAIQENWSVPERNRELVAFLRERGYKPAGGETHDSFNWGSWRNRTGRMLAALFPIES